MRLRREQLRNRLQLGMALPELVAAIDEACHRQDLLLGELGELLHGTTLELAQLRRATSVDEVLDSHLPPLVRPASALSLRCRCSTVFATST